MTGGAGVGAATVQTGSGVPFTRLGGVAGSGAAAVIGPGQRITGWSRDPPGEGYGTIVMSTGPVMAVASITVVKGGAVTGDKVAVAVDIGAGVVRVVQRQTLVAAGVGSAVGLVTGVAAALRTINKGTGPALDTFGVTLFSIDK